MPSILTSGSLDWSSAIGLFIINYGVLDWLLLDYLEKKLPPREFSLIKGRHFHDRALRIQSFIDAGLPADEEKRALLNFLARLKSVRELRNHIAHGHLLTHLKPDGKNYFVTLSLPRNLDAVGNPESRHLEFEELQKALGELTKLIEEFKGLTGTWTGENHGCPVSFASPLQG